MQRALESWQPQFLTGGRMGPSCRPRTSTCAPRLTSAVRAGRTSGTCGAEYRWGVFLAEPEPTGAIALRRAQGRAGVAAGARGVPLGAAAAHRDPGRHRARQRGAAATLGHIAPSLYDLRNLFQVNVEEGRHLWAMVYLLHATSAARAGRRPTSCCAATPAAGLAAHPGRVQRGDAGLAVVLHVHLLHRPRRQVPARHAEGERFDPLSRTCEFMLKEEAHHMFVGTTGVDRVVERTAQLMLEHDTDDVAALRRDPLTSSRSTSTSTTASAWTCSAARPPRTWPTTSPPG